MVKLSRNVFIMIVILMLSVWLYACSELEEPVIDLGNVEEENEVDNNEGSKETGNDDNDVNSGENAGNDTGQEEVILPIDLFKDESVTALVNKQNSLDDSYAPEDLVTIEVPTVLENPEINQLRKVAADALYDMFDVAKESEVFLHARSGYRSYKTQVYLFDSYVENHGEEAANKFSARPGYSEHQTGLVMDVTSESVNYQLTADFGKTAEGIWLSENAHKFGFIIRYPEGKEDITGYVYEPWHIRYLGVEVATAVYESGLTYEEFLVEEGIIHAVNANESE